MDSDFDDAPDTFQDDNASDMLEESRFEDCEGPPDFEEDDDGFSESIGHYGEDDDDRSEFADPGGHSALRAAGPGNPRNLPCPTCGAHNVLTPKDVARHYQCDRCANQDEGGGY